MSTWCSKHVEENSILWINNSQCIKLVINIQFATAVLVISASVKFSPVEARCALSVASLCCCQLPTLTTLKQEKRPQACKLIQRRRVLPYLPSSPGCYTLEQTRVIMDKAFVLITDYEEVIYVLLITEGYDFDPLCGFTVDKWAGYILIIGNRYIPIKDTLDWSAVKSLRARYFSCMTQNFLLWSILQNPFTDFTPSF